MTLPAVLVLAGLDPSGGAGLLADFEAIRAAGARPLCVATALTAQTSRRMHGFQPVLPQLVLQAAYALLAEEEVRAIKVGMLGTAQMARAVGEVIAHARLPTVIDPVLSSSSGGALFQGGPETARRTYAEIWPSALVTPNADEAQALLGLAAAPRDAAALEAAAKELVARGARAALVKGGHAHDAEAIDVLCDANGCRRFAAPRLEATARGTGCRLASSIAAHLALGRDSDEAIRLAKVAVAALLSTADA